MTVAEICRRNPTHVILVFRSLLFRFGETTRLICRQAAELPDRPTASVICSTDRLPVAGGVCDTVCIYRVRYEWDEAKNLRNQRDHGGVTFELAAFVFEDEACLVAPDRIDRITGEQRWHAIGAVRSGPGTVAVLFVVHVYREEQNGEETIRIISARAAEKHEVRRYQEQTID
jgi:uncharacterized DUF497 family protein